MLQSKQRISLSVLLLVGVVLLGAGGAEAAVRGDSGGTMSVLEQPLLKLQRAWTDLVAWWSGETDSAVAKEGAGLSNGG